MKMISKHSESTRENTTIQIERRIKEREKGM